MPVSGDRPAVGGGEGGIELDDIPADAAAGTPSLRSLGTTSTKAAAGNHVHNASAIIFTPQGGIAAATVEGALLEVLAEAGGGGGGGGTLDLAALVELGVAFTENVPALDEMFTTVGPTASMPATADGRVDIPIAKPMRLTSVAIVSNSGPGSGGVDYWTCTLQRGRANGSPTVFAYDDIAKLSTRTSQQADLADDGVGGQVVSAFIPWTFDAILFDDAHSQFLEGDTLKLLFHPSTASAGSWAAKYITVGWTR
jgi:hypothetical protein